MKWLKVKWPELEWLEISICLCVFLKLGICFLFCKGWWVIDWACVSASMGQCKTVWEKSDKRLVWSYCFSQFSDLLSISNCPNVTIVVTQKKKKNFKEFRCGHFLRQWERIPYKNEVSPHIFYYSSLSYLYRGFVLTYVASCSFIVLVFLFFFFLL